MRGPRSLTDQRPGCIILRVIKDQILGENKLIVGLPLKSASRCPPGPQLHFKSRSETQTV